MKITRNGQEIELTAYELTKAHQEYELENMIEDVIGLYEDIKDLYEQKPSVPELDDADFEIIAERALHNLSKNDGYFDAYWNSVEYTLNCYISQNS